MSRNTETGREAFESQPFRRERGLVVDSLEVGSRRHLIHGLVEVDVTRARARIREHRERTGETLSFTAFLVACLARAIQEHPLVHACRDWRGRLVLFDDVDVVTLIESEIDRVAVPHIVRAANRRSLAEVHAEIRRIQASPGTSPQRSGRLARLAAFSPAWLRRLVLRVLRGNPAWLKRNCGTAVVTSVGQFARGGGWGIGIVPLHTLAVVVGGIAEKPGVVDGRIEVREYLHLTLTFDHDLVDGAPAARFARAFTGLLETAAGL
jgi:pyruvate/2-oxoglutarate dehydrogenase complex dihydrolipoamide acyltransferase (E2) component